SRDRVRLRYWRAWHRNWSAPQFVGHFIQRPDGVCLTGTFSWPWQMKSQIVALATMGLLMVILGIVSLIMREPARPFRAAPFVGFAGVIVMFFFLAMHRDIRGSSDTDDLSAVIRNALAIP